MRISQIQLYRRPAMTNRVDVQYSPGFNTLGIPLIRVPTWKTR